MLWCGCCTAALQLWRRQAVALLAILQCAQRTPLLQPPAAGTCMPHCPSRRGHVAAVLGRVNTINGRRYNEDPAIFGARFQENLLWDGPASSVAAQGCPLSFCAGRRSVWAAGRTPQLSLIQCTSIAPCAAGWDLINEPRCFRCGGALAAWVAEMAAYVKALDPNHLLTVSRWQPQYESWQQLGLGHPCAGSSWGRGTQAASRRWR